MRGDGEERGGGEARASRRESGEGKTAAGKEAAAKPGPETEDTRRKFKNEHYTPLILG